MKKIYFDDLFLIIHNDGYTLCEYIPYEQHKELLTVDLKQEYETPEQLIYSLIKVKHSVNYDWKFWEYLTF